MSDNYYPKRLLRIAYENAAVLGAAAHDIIKDAADRMEGLEGDISNLRLANDEARKTIDRLSALIPREANDSAEALASDKLSERLDERYIDPPNNLTWAWITEDEHKEIAALEQRVEQLETEGCGQCEACEDFFPLSLLNMTDDGVFLCGDDWTDLLVEMEALAEEA